MQKTDIQQLLNNSFTDFAAFIETLPFRITVALYRLKENGLPPSSWTTLSRRQTGE